MGEHVDPENLGWYERNAEAHERAEQHNDNLCETAADPISKERADVVINAPALPDGGYDRGEVVVLENEIGGLPRDLGPATPHRDADVCSPQRRTVVDAVSCHRDDMAETLEVLNETELLLGPDPSEDPGPL